MSTSFPVAVSPAPARFRSARIVALAGLALGLSFVADLFALSLLRPSAEFLRGLFYVHWMPNVKPAVVPGLIMIIVSLGVCGFAGWRLAARGQRGLVFSAVLVAAVFAADSLLMVYVWPGIMDSVTEQLSQQNAADFGLVVLIAGVLPLLVTVLVFRLRDWRWIGGSCAALAAILAYLSVDEARPRQLLTFEQISPVLPGDDAAYQVLMRYGKNHPLGKTFRSPTRIFSGHGKFVTANKPGEWRAWLQVHRADVEQDWAELAPVRAWMDELNKFDRISDLMPAEVNAEIITFAPFRSYTHDACAIAGQQALDGHGDDALATLLPLLQVSRKLEPSARSLVRGMVARVMQDEGMAAARFVLDQAVVSPAMRGRLADALNVGVGGEAGARHLLSIESTFFSAATSAGGFDEFIPLEGRPEWVRVSLNVTGPFIYNRWRTAHAHREFTESIRELAARRDLAGIDQAQRAFGAAHARPTFKNLMGDFIVGASVPAYQKVVEAYWRIEDSRTQLLAQLTPASPATQAIAALTP